jgi:DNA-binding transcriptional LysR family regulator
MDRFQEMTVFAAVVDAGSFVGAAEGLDISKAVVSRLVAELENRLGVRLLHRTTRKLSLTEEGQSFYARCKTLLAGVEEAEAEVTIQTGQARGVLKLNVPVTFGILNLAPLWGTFLSQNPAVTLDVTLSDRVVDLVEEGYDLTVRIGRLSSSSLVSRQISSSRMVLCASPAYLKRQARPAHPSQLTTHTIISYSLLSNGDHWEFTGPKGLVKVKVTPRMKTNSGDTCVRAALDGLGIVLQPSFIVNQHLDSGKLVEILPGYQSAELGIYAVYASRHNVPPKVRILIDYLVRAFGDKSWG